MEKADLSTVSTNQVRTLLAWGLSEVSPGTESDLATALAQAADGTNREPVRRVVADLRVPLRAADAGPMSFARLMGLSADEAATFESKSIIDLLTSPSTSAAAIQILADYGDLLRSNVFASSTRLTGEVIFSLASAHLRSLQGEQPAADERQLFETILLALRPA